ncbi:MAG: hypothetical protein IPG51_04690 [Chloroflexi bacterium]|nr:hypothetical protein [Chloroflexota bacterium]
MYASSSLDLRQIGPVVIEVPPNVLGVINDGFFHYLADLGNAGLDRGEGGKHLSCRRDMRATCLRYFVFRSNHLAQLGDGARLRAGHGARRDRAGAFKAHFRFTRWARACTSRASSARRSPSDSTFARDIRYFERLHQMIQYEPVSASRRSSWACSVPWGSEGSPFQPDERMRRILSDGVGWATAWRRRSCSPAATRGPGLQTAIRSGFSPAVASSSATAPGSWTPAPPGTTAHQWSLRRWRPRWSASVRSTIATARRERRLPGRRTELSPSVAVRNSRRRTSGR